MGRIIDRRRVMGGKLPYDAEVEYLEGSGTQWINTGVQLYDSDNVDYAFEIKFIIDVNSERNETLLNAMREVLPYPGMLLRHNWEEENVQLVFNNSRYKVGELGELLVISRKIKSTQRHTLPTTLFASFNSDGKPFRYCHAKLYYFMLWNHGELVCDYIPVRVGQVGYMYDKVSGQLFGNAGTGEFILGPDK